MRNGVYGFPLIFFMCLLYSESYKGQLSEEYLQDDDVIVEKNAEVPNDLHDTEKSPDDHLPDGIAYFLDNLGVPNIPHKSIKAFSGDLED